MTGVPDVAPDVFTFTDTFLPLWEEQMVVWGAATTKGSLKPIVNPRTGRVFMKEQTSAKLKPWQTQIRAAARAAFTGPAAGPVVVQCVFYQPRPGGHYGTGRNAGRLKPSAPWYPTVRTGDGDKLLRVVLDVLTGVAYRDDSQVVDAHASRRYAAGGTDPHAVITVCGLKEPVRF